MATLLEVVGATVRKYRELHGRLPDCIALHPTALKTCPTAFVDIWTETMGRCRVLVDPACPPESVHVGDLRDFCRPEPPRPVDPIAKRRADLQHAREAWRKTWRKLRITRRQHAACADATH